MANTTKKGPENLGENVQQVEVFDIKEQKMEELDKTSVDAIQSIFRFNFEYNDKMPEIMAKNGISKEKANSYMEIDEYIAKKNFPYFLKQIEEGLDKLGNMQYNKYCRDISYRKKATFIFKINKVFIKDGKYFMYTSNGQILTVNKNDFDQNGLFAKSLCFFSKSSSDDIGGNTSKTVFENKLESEAKGDGFIHFYDKGKNVFDIPGNKIFKIENGNVLIYDGGILSKYKILGQSNYKKGETFEVPYKGITQMVVDYNMNFLLIVNETDEGSTLHIISYDDFINKHEITEYFSIKNVKEICGLGKENGMFCEMDDGSMQYFRNTFSKFERNFFKDKEDGTPGGKLIYPKDQEITTISDSGKSKLLKDLTNGTFFINFEEDVVDKTDKIDQDIIDKIWDIKIPDKEETLRELFDKANDEESITLVWKIFKKIKKNPQIAKVGGITKSIDKEILDKKNEIILNSIFSELGDITTELGEAPDLATLITIKDKLKMIQKKRKNIQAGIVSQDKELKNLLEITEQKISDYKELHKEDLETEIQKNLENIKEILDNIENAIDISSIYSTSLYQTTEDMISCLDKDGQETFQKKLRDLVQGRLNELREISNKTKKDEAEIIENKKRKAEEYLNQIREILDEIDDIDKIEQLKEDGVLVQKTKNLLDEIPSSEAQVLNLKLDKIFGERIFALRLNGEESKGVIQNLDTYGIDTILYYDEDGTEKVDWEIEGKERPDGKISLVVKLMNGETHEYDKSLYLKEAQKYGGVHIRGKKIKFDMDEDDYYKYQSLLYEWKEGGQSEKYYELIKQLRKLPTTGEDEENMPEEKKKIFNKIKDMRKKYGDIIYTEHLISRLIKQQKLNPRSKVPPFNPNYIVLDEEKEILKTLSTRLVDQKHNSGIEILEGGPGLGKTVMCEFLASVTNREIIRVQCSKMDPSDMFFSPTLKKGETSREPADWIKLMQKPGTIILFDEIDKLNDQCFERLHSLFDSGRSVYDPQLGKIKANADCLFLGTRNSYDRLSNPILSRGRILQINYPPVLNEAYKISKYSDSSVLKKLSYEDFQMLYDKYITRGESAPNNTHEKKIYNLVININHLLNVFTSLRKLYESEEPFVFELSYRDARQIFVDYNNSGDFKSAMENVLIPKARGAVIDPDEKKTQEDMVRNAINGEM